MSALRLIGPGSAVPGWVEVLDREIFGQAWGALDDAEWLWTSEEAGYARWSAVPAIAEAELLRIAVAPGARGRGLGETAPGGWTSIRRPGRR